MEFISVFIGGGFGALLRYLTSINLTAKIGGMPIGTLIVNIIASLILGAAFGFISYKANLQPNIKILITTGFCGGLSTFSTFAFEIFEMIKAGQFAPALSYIILSTVCCVCAAALGVFLMKII